MLASASVLFNGAGKIDSLLAGILALFMLYSINFDVMGKPNIGLFDTQNLGGWWFVGIFVLIVIIFLSYLLNSRLGLMLRAFGEHPALLSRLGHRIEGYRFFGFGLSNLLVAWGGALTAEINGYADLSMGFGMALTGIGTVVIGKQLLKPFYHSAQFHLPFELAGCALGVFLYFFGMDQFLAWGVNPINLKLILGLILVAFLRLTSRRKSRSNL